VRRSKEIMILLALLLGMMGFVTWYVIDRRAKLHAVPAAPAPTAAQTPTGPSAVLPPPAPAAPVVASPVDLTQHDSQTIDFSSGSPVVKDTAEDRAALEQAKKDMAEAVKGVTFGPPAKKAVPPPAPSAEPSKP
jgi:zona occludens toxin (predicted ATPase)